MEKINVISSSLSSIGHEGTTLEVQFKNGHVYQYSDVPLEVFQKLRISQSVGASFASLVIKGGYPYKKL